MLSHNNDIYCSLNLYNEATFPNYSYSDESFNCKLKNILGIVELDFDVNRSIYTLAERSVTVIQELRNTREPVFAISVCDLSSTAAIDSHRIITEVEPTHQARSQIRRRVITCIDDQ